MPVGERVQVVEFFRQDPLGFFVAVVDQALDQLTDRLHAFTGIVVLGVSCWHLLQGRNVDVFRRAAALALAEQTQADGELAWSSPIWVQPG